MTANESITHAEPTGHDEAALERIAIAAHRVLVTEWHADQCGCARFTLDDEGDLVECASRESGYTMSNPFSWSPDAIVAALSSAGFLATEQEWAIKTEDGTVLDGARDQAYAERWAAGCTHTNGLTGEVRTGTAVAVSRRVTAWTEVDA